MPQKPKRKLPLYIPRIMTDLMWATTKDSTSIHFGFGHKCHKHGRLFDLEHVRTCSELTGCPDIAKYARMIKEGGNIRQWDQEVLADAIVQYTQLALQLANMTAKADDHAHKREQMAVDLRKSKRQDLISKKRQDMALNQILQEGAGYSE